MPEETASGPRVGPELAAVTQLLRGDPLYPPLLDRIHTPPPLLYVLGEARLLSRPAIAVVGTRRPTREGVLFAERLAADLTARGLVVVSGMAYGIDAAAHRGALAGGSTIAVLAAGVDVPSPRGNLALYERIACAGAVVSEFPPGTRARDFHFVQRNRIISGLALGTVVVEAGERSGALITARYAREQDREVFAVPGSPLRETSAGPNALLKDGAALVRGWEDVVRELEAQLGDALEVPAEAASRQGSGAWGDADGGDQTGQDRAVDRADGVRARARRDGARVQAARRAEHAVVLVTPKHLSAAAAGRGEGGGEARGEPLLARLGSAPRHVDELQAETGSEIAALLAELSELEILGAVTQLPGKYFVRAARG